MEANPTTHLPQFLGSKEVKDSIDAKASPMDPNPISLCLPIACVMARMTAQGATIEVVLIYPPDSGLLPVPRTALDAYNMRCFSKGA